MSTFRTTTIKQLVNRVDPKRKTRKIPMYKFPGKTFFHKRGSI